MTPCAQLERLQAYLDGELNAAAETDLRRHLVDCEACAAELALYERVFASLASAETWDPGPELTERILARVLPSQVRRRWMRALGWSYGFAAAGSVACAVALLAQPSVRALFGTLGVGASQRVAQAAVFIIDSLALAMVRLASGWGLIHEIGLRLSPVLRALTTVLARPGVDVTLGLATMASALLLWWLRPRDLGASQARARRGIEHAGLLFL